MRNYSFEALDIRRKTLGDKHRRVALSLNNLGDMLRRKGDYKEAERLLRQALALWREQLGEAHPDVALALVSLSRVLIAQQRTAEAEPLLREATGIRRNAFPPGHWATAQAESTLGACLTALGRYQEAEPLLVKGYEDLKAARGVKDRNTQGAIRHLVAYYEAVGESDQVAAYRALLTPPAQ